MNQGSFHVHLFKSVEMCQRLDKELNEFSQRDKHARGYNMKYLFTCEGSQLWGYDWSWM